MEFVHGSFSWEGWLNPRGGHPLRPGMLDLLTPVPDPCRSAGERSRGQRVVWDSVPASRSKKPLTDWRKPTWTCASKPWVPSRWPASDTSAPVRRRVSVSRVCSNGRQPSACRRGILTLSRDDPEGVPAGWRAGPSVSGRETQGMRQTARSKTEWDRGRGVRWATAGLRTATAAAPVVAVLIESRPKTPVRGTGLQAA